MMYNVIGYNCFVGSMDTNLPTANNNKKRPQNLLSNCNVQSAKRSLRQLILNTLLGNKTINKEHMHNL